MHHFLSSLPPPYPLHAILLPSQSFVVPHYQWQKAQTNRGRYQEQEEQAEQRKADQGRQTLKVSDLKMNTVVFHTHYFTDRKEKDEDSFDIYKDFA